MWMVEVEQLWVDGGGGAASGGCWRWSSYERTVVKLEQLQVDSGGGAAMRGQW